MTNRFDFDQILNRQQSDSIKWQKYAGQDVIPMWVADMDFASPPEVIDALQQRVSEQVFGYGHESSQMAEAFCDWYATRYQWSIDPSWIVWLPGLVCGLHAVAKAFGAPDAGLMTHTPVYPPFLKLAERNQQQLQAVPMLKPEQTGSGWQLDFVEMAKQVTAQTKLFMLCHPHNPTGRAFTRHELEQLADFCLQHDLLLCSDEIHCDLVLSEQVHIPMASLSDAIAARCITLLAPSKTFNIAGLACSAAVIPDPALRKQFKRAIQGFMPEVNILGFVAAEAAYRSGTPWLEALREYLRGNRQLLSQWASTKHKVGFIAPEATYLGWLDLRAYGLEKPAQWLLEQTGVALSEGSDFGCPGFARINFGCPKAQLQAALQRLDQVLS